MSIKNRHNRAFTLIEILVVMVIILIVTTMAVLAIGDAGRARRVKYTAQTLVSLLNYAETYAILTPATLRLEVDGQNYKFSRLVVSELANKKLNSSWQAAKNELLEQKTLPNFAIAKLNNPVLFNSNGSITPFTLTLRVQNEKKAYIITGNLAGNISLQYRDES